MSVNKSLGKRLLIATAPLAAMLIAFGGCADYAAVGVGYSDAYYVPDYHPFYGTYFYDGYPWWGSGPYVVNKYVVKDVHRNGYYGRHHYVGNAWRRGGGGRFNIGARGRHHI